MFLLALMLLSQAPCTPELAGAFAVDADHAWVVGTRRCDICATTALLALADFTTGDARSREVPRAKEKSDTQYGRGAPGATPDSLEAVAASGNVVAAVGHQACEVGFSPFAVVSVDGGKTFVRRELEVGAVYSAFAMGISVSGSKVTVRVGVARTSDDDPRPVCFDLEGLGAPRRLGKCPSVSAAAKVRQRGSEVLDAKGRAAKLR